MSLGDLLLGIDLGGTKIEAAILDRHHQWVVRERRPTPQSDYAQLLHTIRGLILSAEERTRCSDALPIGMGTPGSPSPASGLLRGSNSQVLNGKRLARDLGDLCGRPVRVANDADCFTLSEAVDGAGAGSPSTFGVILGTGVGGGLCLGRQLLQGRNGITGEWGHNRLMLERVPDLPAVLRNPRRCYCGRDDCVETWLSGAGLALTHRQLHGCDIEIERLHESRPDRSHGDTLELYSALLAAALAAPVNILDPHVIVLGGGLSNLDYLYERLPELLARQVFSDVCTTPVKKALHGDSSGVRGAAWLWEGPA